MDRSIGSVSAMFRFPVKSLRGECLEAATLTRNGMIGDRLWAFRDEQRGETASAKHTPALLQLAATIESVNGGPRARIEFPCGEFSDSSDPRCAERVSDFLGNEVTLHGIKPATETDHYARAPIAAEDFEQFARELFALKDEEPLPDLSMLPAEAMFYTSLPGTYFDVTPIHIVLRSELDRLQECLPDTELSLLRFRPNVVIDDRESPQTSTALVGSVLRMGESVEVSIDMTTPRCAMTTHAQADLPRAKEVMRELVRGWKHSFGVYGTIRQGGSIRLGTPIRAIG